MSDGGIRLVLLWDGRKPPGAVMGSEVGRSSAALAHVWFLGCKPWGCSPAPLPAWGLAAGGVFLLFLPCLKDKAHRALGETVEHPLSAVSPGRNKGKDWVCREPLKEECCFYNWGPDPSGEGLRDI